MLGTHWDISGPEQYIDVPQSAASTRLTLNFTRALKVNVDIDFVWRLAKC